MTDAPSDRDRTAIDWESFYRNFRKPGYIPGFEITSKLGGGMFGLVFKARKQSIGRDYAIKFLKVDDTEVQQAVLAELEAVRYFAQVDHPNLVSIEDRGEVDGIPYIVMAYAGSETLRDRLSAAAEQPGIARLELVAMCLQASRGVQALHERSLVHFDLKPANVFLRGNVARVGDYGLSKLVAQSRNTLSMGRGTPYYMAPEMLQRKGDYRSDIYSLGVVLYECWTGDVPFRGESEWEVLRKHENEPPRYPDSVPPAQREVLARCLAKQPGDRFGSVAEMIEAARSAGAPGDAVADPRPTAPRPEAAAAVGPATPAPGAPSFDELRQAARQLREDARRVGANARQLASEKVQEARDAMGTSHSWRSLRRSMRRVRGVRPDQAFERLARPWPRPRVRPVLIVLVLVLVAFAFLLTPARHPRVGPAALAPQAVPSLADQRKAVAAQVRRFGSPGPFFARYKDGSRDLSRELTEWQQTLPQTPQAVAQMAKPWPDHVLPAGSIPPDQRAALTADLQQVIEGRDADRSASTRLIAAGYPAFALAVKALADQDVQSTDGFERAVRINALLCDLTGVTAIRLRRDRRSPPSGRYAELNELAARQWRWFFSERLGSQPKLVTLYRAAKPVSPR